MSILAKNIKTVRKELRCTQSAMSDILKVGFRTYVRYEDGERDAPVSVLVKLARLGNVSLEQLLTEEIDSFHVSPLQGDTLANQPPEVKSCNFRTGQISFKKPSKEMLLTVDDSEKKLLSIFRKISQEQQAEYLESLQKSPKSGGAKAVKPKGRAEKKVKKAKATSSVKKAAKPKLNSVGKPNKKGRPGRKKVDKKVLREKIDKLKMITKSINKITVR